MGKKLIGKACKHAFTSFHANNPNHDLLTAKITEYYDDGSEESKLVMKEDYQRDFYIVKPKYRTFKDKHDYIELHKTKKFKSNQSRLARNISKVLYGRDDPQAKLGDMKNSPYVFGCYISPAVELKQRFYKKYYDTQTKALYSVAAYDVETYVTEDGIGDINMASITMGSKVYWCGTREFFQGDDDETILRKLNEHVKEYLDPEYIKEHKVEFVFELANTSTEVVTNNIKAFHRFAPDYIVSWNANFDMTQNEKALLAGNIDPKTVYSDPRVPKVYQAYDYYQGREFKKSAAKGQAPLDDQERFPVLRAPATWQWFDGMSFYALARTAKGKRDSYTLQYTAKSEGIPGKLYTEHGQQFDEGSGPWHRYMQKFHPYIYAMYNIQDNFVIEDLNRKTQDYSLALPSLLMSSELPTYQSKPSLISDDYHQICLEEGFVWGCVGNRDNDRFEKIKPDRRDWIGILKTELNELNGIQLFDGLPCCKTSVHADTNDIDVFAAYPNGGIAANVSNRTTRVEVCEIEGFDRIDFRRFGIHYASSVEANAVWLANKMYGLPRYTEMKEFYLNEVVPFIESDPV